MKTAHEPPLRAGEDEVLRALASIIATTRPHWRLPAERRPGTTIGAGIAPQTFSLWPWPGTPRIIRRPRPPG